MKRSVRTEFLAIIIPVIAVSMILLSFLGYIAAKEIIRKNTQEKMEQSLTSAVESIRVSLSKNQKVAELLARSFESASDVMKEDNFKNVLTSFAGTNKETSGAGIWYEPGQMDPGTRYFSRYCMREGDQVVYVPDYSLGDGVYYNTQDWYTSVQNTDKSAVWSSPYYDDVAKISMVTASVPLYDKSGKFIGVSTADMDLTDLQSMVASIKPYAEGTAFLIDGNGTYIASEDSSKALKVNIKEETDPSMAALGGEILAKRAGAGNYKQNGETYGIWYTQIPECDWIIAIAAPESILYSDLHSLGRNLILLCITITLILVTMLCLFINSRIIRPLKRLQDVSQEISAGNLSVIIKSASNNEFGHVSTSLKDTAERLGTYIDYIHELSMVLDMIAEGNLDFTLQLEYSGEFSRLMRSIDNIKQSLTHTLRQIHLSAGQVSTGASSISENAQMLAQGTTEQAHTMDKLTSMVQNISDNVKSNAEHAAQASHKAKNVEAHMQASNQKMDSMLQAMKQISDSSGKISKIISSIEDIAFQTNILALNAAVEAARAGASGKGFAVVADEVRNLASKSAEAAKNTSGLIVESVFSVENGTQILNDTARTLSMAANGVNEISGSIEQISSATRTQSDAITQIVLGLEEISSGIQANSATSEESASASAELSNQAQNLFKQVSNFKVAEGK